MIYLILGLLACFYIILLVWVLWPERVLCGIVKEDKRCIRAKNLVKLFNASEISVLRRIIYNMPVLGDDTPQHIESLKNSGFNMSLPVYKIDIGGRKNLKLLFSELKILKRLECAGYPLNIVINFNGFYKNSDIRNNFAASDFGLPATQLKNFSYNDILILTASLNFEKSVVKIHQAEFLGAGLMFAVNAFNINKACVNLMRREREGVWIETGGKTLDCSHKYYDDFSYKGSASSGEINISHKKTTSFKKNYTIERLAISNLGKRSAEVILNAFFALGIDEDESCFSRVLPHKGGIKIVDYKNKTERCLSASCGIMKNLNVTKLGIKGQMRVKIRGGSVFYAYIVHSNELISVQNLERGEELFFEAKSEYKNLSPLKVQSNNLSFDRLINLLLPERIISKFIDSPSSIPDFDRFRNLICESRTEYVNSLKGVYVKNDNVVGSYFDLLWQFAGVSFLEKGIRINMQRKWLLDDITLRFIAEGNPITVKIKKQGIEHGFICDGVEFYNVGFLPYRMLAHKNNTVICM